jgi:hypothetical protein
MDIKEPRFDRPVGLGATSEKKPVDSHEVEITEGKRVFLIYKGWLMGAMVTQVVMPGAVFVGRVLAFEGNELTHGELKYDDLFRFRKADVRWIDWAVNS